MRMWIGFQPDLASTRTYSDRTKSGFDFGFCQDWTYSGAKPHTHPLQREGLFAMRNSSLCWGPWGTGSTCWSWPSWHIPPRKVPSQRLANSSSVKAKEFTFRVLGSQRRRTPVRRCRVRTRTVLELEPWAALGEKVHSLLEWLRWKAWTGSLFRTSCWSWKVSCTGGRTRMMQPFLRKGLVSQGRFLTRLARLVICLTTMGTK